MSLIVENTVGLNYEQSVFHLGVAFAHEVKSMSAYGHSFRIEYSHRSGSIHIQCMGGGQGGFKEWLGKHSDALTTSVETGFLGRKRRVIGAALQKIESAYAQYLTEPKQ